MFAVVVTPVLQPPGLFLTGRGRNQDEHSVGVPLYDLQRPLWVDLEHYVRATRWLHGGCAVKVAVTGELVPLDKPAGRNAVDELFPAYPDIGVLWFRRPAGPGGPRARQPQSIAQFQEARHQRAFPDPARTKDHEDQRGIGLPLFIRELATGTSARL